MGCEEKAVLIAILRSFADTSWHGNEPINEESPDIIGTLGKSHTLKHV